MRIGLSVAMCVRDVITRHTRIKDVAFIIAGTDAITERGWNFLMEQSRVGAWHMAPDLGEKLANDLRNSGKILHPEVLGLLNLNAIKQGLWITLPTLTPMVVPLQIGHTRVADKCLV